MKNIVQNDFFLEEIRCGYKVSSLMKHVWAVELDLMEKLKDICERNNLKFFMAGGTLLGAVRHSGFIPWDDDADFLMPREDFEKLKKLAPHEIKDPYYFKAEMGATEVFHGGFARLINKNTTGIVHLNIENAGESGIWIDISILDNIFDDKIKREKQVRRIRHLQRLLFAKTFAEFKSFLGLSSSKWKAYKIGSVLYPRTYLIKQLYKALIGCSMSHHVACFTYHHDQYQPFLYDCEDYRDTVLLDFESLKLPAPIGYDRHLRTQYGDYLQYPPEENRGIVRAAILDPFIPYDSFLLNFNRIVKDLEGKTLVVFGAGQMLEHYLQNEGKNHLPEFAVDNDEKKWGTAIRGILVTCPEALLNVPKDKLQIIICSIYYREIAKQLRESGINRYYIYVQELGWL